MVSGYHAEGVMYTADVLGKFLSSCISIPVFAVFISAIIIITKEPTLNNTSVSALLTVPRRERVGN